MLPGWKWLRVMNCFWELMLLHCLCHLNGGLELFHSSTTSPNLCFCYQSFLVMPHLAFRVLLNCFISLIEVGGAHPPQRSRSCCHPEVNIHVPDSHQPAPQHGGSWQLGEVAQGLAMKKNNHATVSTTNKTQWYTAIRYGMVFKTQKSFLGRAFVTWTI